MKLNLITPMVLVLLSSFKPMVMVFLGKAGEKVIAPLIEGPTQCRAFFINLITPMVIVFLGKAGE